MSGAPMPGLPASRLALEAAASRVVERLPKGTSQGEALLALGEPKERRTPYKGCETWHYCRYLDEHQYAFATTILTFDGGRLVNASEYRFL